ncbi:MAG: DUF6171 family protein [Bacillota bacterium]
MMEDKCNGCATDVYVSDDDIEEAVKKAMASGMPLADREQYEKRLEACRTCDQLVYGTTCMSCGCLVKVRALFALRICPHASGSRW